MIDVAIGLAVMVMIWGEPAVASEMGDQNWGCYDAKPGHPTLAERTAFIGKLAPTAQKAELEGGPPAAGLLAMSALESGYGWTRTAVFANNLFGWKFVSSVGAGGRGSWKLECQPASDPNNLYLVFRDHQDSLGFVADRLKTNSRYAGATRQYHADRAMDMKPNEAVARWIKKVAASGYNPYQSYPTKVLYVANNYLHPGPVESPDASLYRWAANADGAPTQPAALVSQVNNPNAAASAALSALANLERSHYLSAKCDASPITDWQGYEGRNVRRCTYSVTSAGMTLQGLVYLLNPLAENLATRIGYACNAVGLGDQKGCGRYLASFIINQNGAQFPVAGLVVERKRDAGGQGDDPVYLEFRDGVTVMTQDRLNFTDRPLSTATMEHAAHAPLVSTRTYARVANATRDDYFRAGGAEEVGRNSNDDKSNRWPGAVRRNELRAQDTGQDELLRGVAIGLRSSLVLAK